MSIGTMLRVCVLCQRPGIASRSLLWWQNWYGAVRPSERMGGRVKGLERKLKHRDLPFGSEGVVLYEPHKNSHLVG